MNNINLKLNLTGFVFIFTEPPLIHRPPIKVAVVVIKNNCQRIAP